MFERSLIQVNRKVSQYIVFHRYTFLEHLPNKSSLNYYTIKWLKPVNWNNSVDEIGDKIYELQDSLKKMLDKMDKDNYRERIDIKANNCSNIKKRIVRKIIQP